MATTTEERRKSTETQTRHRCGAPTSDGKTCRRLTKGERCVTHRRQAATSKARRTKDESADSADALDRAKAHVGEALEEHTLAEHHGRIVVDHAVKAGNALLEAKALVLQYAKTSWTDWLEANWVPNGVSIPTARRYMRAAAASTVKGAEPEAQVTVTGLADGAGEDKELDLTDGRHLRRVRTQVQQPTRTPLPKADEIRAAYDPVKVKDARKLARGHAEAIQSRIKELGDMAQVLEKIATSADTEDDESQKDE